MKKTLKTIFIITVIVSLLSIVGAVLSYIKMSSKPENQTYYINVSVVKQNNKYFLRGTIESKKTLSFENLYFVFTFKYDDEQFAHYNLYYGKAEGTVINFNSEISEYDLDYEKNPLVYKLGLTEDINKTPLDIYEVSEYTKNITTQSIPSYILMAVGMAGSGLSLFLVIKITDEKDAPLSLKVTDVKTEKSSSKKIRCPYCNCINDRDSIRCSQCGGNLMNG